MEGTHEVVVVGAGVAGLTAGLFAARYGYSTLIIERSVAGGHIANAERVENYPGFPRGIPGAELVPLIADQAADAGAEIVLDEVNALKSFENLHLVQTSSGEFRAKVVIVAGGSRRRDLGIPGEAELRGRGVSECATCDGALFAGQLVAVAGGGDSALDEAQTLSAYASEVRLFHRGRSLRGQKVLRERVAANPRIDVRCHTSVDEVVGDDRVVAIKVRDLRTGATSQVDVSGLFVCVGLDPNTAYLKGRLHLDRAGHIATDIWMRTAVPGVFAAGDIRQNSAAQTVCAAGDGATAAIAAHRYLGGDPWPMSETVETKRV